MDVAFLYVSLEHQHSGTLECSLRRQVTTRADPKMDDAFNDVKPIFVGDSIRLQFFKDHVCPRTFVSSFENQNGNQQQLGKILMTIPIGQIKVNLFLAPLPDHNLSAINHLEHLHHVCQTNPV